MNRALARLLPLFLVGPVLAAALAACGGGNGGETERILGRVLGSSLAEDAQVTTFVGGLPDSLPWDIPRHDDAEVVISFVVEDPAASTYVVMLDQEETTSEILDFYEEALDGDPWQVESVVSSRELMALRFTKIDDPNVEGAMTVSNLREGGSGVLLTVQAAAEEGAATGEPFRLEDSRPLPTGFPSDVPIYPDATVIESSWQRSPGQTSFLVTFLTTDPRDDVFDFYRAELAERDLPVDEGPEPDSGSASGLSFGDAQGELQGNVTAGTFEEDSTYTRVDLQLRVGSDRGTD